jgi:RNA polymerase sigma-70 factor, ECF subfamily
MPFVTAATHAQTAHDAPVDDAALVRQSLGGDERSFAELIRRHKSRVFGTCSRFARDSHELDDLCQEVFLRAYRKLSGFRGEAPFEHWLATLTVSVCYDYLRKERRHRENLAFNVETDDRRDTAHEAATSARTAKELLDWAMRQLDAEDHLIVTLLELEERSVREIADVTGWGESKVKVRAFRARLKLKQIIEASHES